MINFNLLPWRATLRRQQYQTLKTALYCAALFGVAISMIWHITLHYKIAYETKTLHALQQELTLLRQQEQQQKKLQQELVALQQQDNFVEQTENVTIRNIELLAVLGKIISPFIALDSIQKSADFIRVTGKIISLKAFATFMQKLSKINWLEAPLVQEIKNNNINNMQDNSFTIRLVGKKQEIKNVLD